MKSPPKTKLVEIAEEFNLKLILVFGSQVLGQTHKESDVDLAFLPEKNLSFEDEILLNTKFCGLFRTDRVDTVNLKKAHPLLLKQVLDNCQILFQKNPQVFSIFEAQVLQKYEEAKPLFEMRHEKLKELVKTL